MLKDCFAKLTPEAFLQAFVIQSSEIGHNLGCNHCNQQGSYIEQLGLGASGFFEAAYRKNLELDKELDPATYADLIITLKNKIGGNFARMSSEKGMVRVRSSRCPFGDSVKQAPELCQMTSSVFGGIAARNFGYAKVILDKRIALGHDCCEVRIFLDREKGKDFAGDEYHKEQGVIRSAATDSEISARIEERMYKVWCDTVRAKSNREHRRPLLVAKSDAMCKALGVVDVVGPTLASVLITGETGVGKEVIARAVHAMSDRHNKKFVAVNCGAIPENLIESALFGHERGAFTGAHHVHHGLFEQAERSTLLLDEIDSLPLNAQVRLLRVLQEGEFNRVGGENTLKADVRIIAAASEPIAGLVEKGSFREDLYYRLNVVPIYLPPLRDRPDDIPELVDHFLKRLSVKYGKTLRGIGSGPMAQILAHDWPGNVRELENVLERSMLFCTAQVLDVLLMSETGRDTWPLAENAEINIAGEPAKAGLFLKDAKKKAAARIEEQILRENLKRFRGNITAVARNLHLTRRSIHQKVRAHSINPSPYRKKAETSSSTTRS